MRKRIFKALKADKLYDISNIIFSFFINLSCLESKSNIALNCKPWKKV